MLLKFKNHITDSNELILISKNILENSLISFKMENFEHTRKNLGLTNSKSKDKDILNTYLPINNESVIEILKIQNKELRNDVSILKRLVYM